MELIIGGESRAVVTVHLGGEPAVLAAEFLIRKFKQKSGIQLELRRSVGFDDITRCLQISLSTTSNRGPQEKEVTTPEAQGRQIVPEDGFVADLARVEKEIGVILSAPTIGCLITAVGQLLRGIDFGRNSARLVRLPPKLFQPEKSVRGAFLLMAPGSEYAVWPELELRTLFEDWAFWGINTILTRYDIHAIRSDFQADPKGQGSLMLARHQLVARIAHELGMKFGLVTVANSAYLDRVMVNLRAQDSSSDLRRGGSPSLLCPSAHQGRSYILQDREGLFRDIQPIDILWIWPFDSGGCWCERCEPWAKTFLGLSQEIARTLKRYHSKSKAYVGTRWFLPAEFDILEEYLATDPDWLDGIVLDEGDMKRGWRHPAELKRMAARFSKKSSLIFCPEISLTPFPVIGDRICLERGRLGASPRVTAMHQQYSQLAPFISGVASLSETVGDDLAKIAYAQWSWSLPENPEEVVKEYWRWHFDGDGDSGWDLVKQMEVNEDHTGASLVEKEVHALAVTRRRADAAARDHWRWKVFSARVSMDEMLYGIGSAQKVFSKAAGSLRKAARGRARSAMARSAKEVLKNLRAREKKVQNFVKAAQALQHNVYRVGPERETTLQGLQLAEDCGRGSGQKWIARLVQALKKKKVEDLKGVLRVVAMEMYATKTNRS